MSTEQGAQPLEVPGQRLLDRERAAERGGERVVRGQEGDLPVDLPGVEAAGQLLDRAGAGDGRARVQQEGAGPGARHCRPWGRDQRVAAREHGRPAGGGGERRRPQHRLLQLAPVGDHLDLPALRHELERQAGCRLDADLGDVVGEPEAPRERRLARAGWHAPPAVPAGGVDEHRREGVEPQPSHVGARRGDLAGAAGARVLDRHAQVDLVQVDGERRAAGGEREQVAADPGAQVGDPLEARVAGGPVAGDLLGGRLLEPVAGEVHPLRVRELRPRPHAQVVLRQCGPGQRRRVARPQLLAEPDLRPGLDPVPVAERAEQLPPARGQEQVKRPRGVGRLPSWSGSSSLAHRGPPRRSAATPAPPGRAQGRG